MAFSPLLSWIESEIIRFHFQVCNHASAYPYPVCLFQTLVSPSCFASLFSSDFWNQVCQGRRALVRNSGRCSLPYGGDLTKRPSCCRVLFVVATPCLTDGVHKEARQDRHATSVVQQPGPPIPGIPVFPYRQKRRFQSEWQATAKF